ncbi:MAG: hypothetical protein E7257_02195 [Lachnospiraceae bacterium]|nr:hypothetical protein [Lachnospiraceae bacterium]MBQ9936032.1 hypothetical protein [Lachnospiraceae bacterium]
MDLKSKYRYARAFVVLMAALITLILNIKYEREIIRSLVIMLIVIIIFYVISTVAIKLIDVIRNLDTKVEEINDEDEDEIQEEGKLQE